MGGTTTLPTEPVSGKQSSAVNTIETEAEPVHRITPDWFFCVAVDRGVVAVGLTLPRDRQLILVPFGGRLN